MDKQVKFDLVSVQINTIKVYFQIRFSILNAHMARKYGSQNVHYAKGENTIPATLPGI